MNKAHEAKNYFALSVNLDQWLSIFLTMQRSAPPYLKLLPASPPAAFLWLVIVALSYVKVSKKNEREKEKVNKARVSF